ncbi:MAG: SDR family oxidoreductase [Limisphaerales bacterium]
MQKLAWITGAGGLIGNYLVQSAPQFGSSWKVRGLTRAELDLTDAGKVREKFLQENPQLIIHCAALSRSPLCQINPSLAQVLNVEVTRVLAELASEIPLIFFSSDLVFDGRKGNYTESDSVNPLTVYAKTKIAAEQIILKNPKHSVLRTSLNGGNSPMGDRGFNEELRNFWEAGKTVKLFTDEFRVPIPAVVTARAVWELVGQNQPGIYHLAGSERLSRFQIGQLLAARWPQLHPNIEPIRLRDYQGEPRPPDSSLCCEKIQKMLSFRIPEFSEWLRQNPAEKF